MGAFWNPGGGIIVSNEGLRNKRVLILKRKWSENRRLPFSPVMRRCWGNIKIAVLTLFSC